MVDAWKATERHALTSMAFRNIPLRLEPRDTPGFTVSDLQKDLKLEDPKKRSLAAMGLSWRQRTDRGQRLDLPVLKLDKTTIILLPGESYVEFQLLAQQLRPDDFVVAIGYGDCATGYVPIESAWRENDNNLNPWCWVAPGAEKSLAEAMRTALNAQ